MDIVSGTDAQLDQISNLVSIAFDDLDLDYNTIRQDVFLGDANIRMKRYVPNWEDLTGDDEKSLEIGTMKLCAVNLLIAHFRSGQDVAEQLNQSRTQLTPKEAIDMYIADIEEIVDDVRAEDDPDEGKKSRYISAAVVI